MRNPWKTHWALTLVKGIRGKEKILLTSVGIEPTTSGLDLPLLCQLSYEVGQRKSGTVLGRSRFSWVSHSTLIYTSEVIFCSTICVHSATRHNIRIHMYPYFLLAAIHHLKSSLTFSDRPCSLCRQSNGSHQGQMNFFFTSCGSLIPFTRANAQWVFGGFHIAL